MIALVDYGAGNLTSVRKALAALSVEVITPRAPDDLSSASGIIVPGVGHFGATAALDARWRSAIVDAMSNGAGVFGICLGMQWLFEGSEEAPELPGMSLFAGRCTRLQARTDAGVPQQSPAPALAALKVPHVGWNSLALSRSSGLMTGVAADAQVYFTHSYVAPPVTETVARATHGLEFSAAVQRGRIAGVQFHPEKSGPVGLRILRNWLDAV